MKAATQQTGLIELLRVRKVRLPLVARRQFTLANSNRPNHTAQTRALHAYLRWRNKNARHPDVLAAQRRERARIPAKGASAGAADPYPPRPDHSTR